MPDRVPGSRNYRFNRVVWGVGRIARSAGTSDLREFRFRDALLTKLVKAEALDVLRQFKRGELSVRDLIEADRKGDLTRAPERRKLTAPLHPAVKAWLPECAPAASTRRRHEVSWNALKRVASLPSGSTVERLASLDWKRLRHRWPAGPAHWNRMRAFVSAFLTDHLGHAQHPFRLEVMAQFPTAEEPAGNVPDLSVAEFWSVIGAARVDTQAAFVTMVVLGVGPAELRAIAREDLNAATYTVVVRGTKRGRLRKRRQVVVDPMLWVYIELAIPCRLGYQGLRNQWDKACELAKVKGVTLYSLRHLSAQLAADSGESERDIAVHMGHDDPKMTLRYTRRRKAWKVAKAIGEALKARPSEAPTPSA